MALKNSTDRGALERLLLSRLPRKGDQRARAELHAAPYRELMSYYRCAMMEGRDQVQRPQ